MNEYSPVVERCPVRGFLWKYELQVKGNNASSGIAQRKTEPYFISKNKLLVNSIRNRTKEVEDLNSHIILDFGNGIIKIGEVEKTFDFFADIYLKSYYPYDLTSNKLIFIPNVFITDTSDIVDEKQAEAKLKALEKEREMMKNRIIISDNFDKEKLNIHMKEIKRLKSKINRHKGEKVEKDIYDFLKEYFDKYDGKVIVFHGYTIASRPQISKKEENAEKDFIILLDTGYVINIECKLTNHEENIKNACSQLKSFHNLFQDWFADDSGYFVFAKNWQIISIVYCDQQHDTPIANVCKTCSLESILKKICCSAHNSDKTEWADDLNTIFRHMLFTISAHTPLVPRNVGQVVEKQLQQNQGSAEVIQFFSPLQCDLLVNDPKKVVFNSHWGTGKTKLLLQKAKTVAKNHVNQTVILFTCYDKKMKSLFSLKMENNEKLKSVIIENKTIKLDNLLVVPVENEKLFDSIEKEIKMEGRENNCHVFVDEFYATKNFHCFVQGLRGIANLLGDNYLWVVLAGIDKLWINDKLKKGFKEIPGLENFYIPELNKPMRSTKCIIEYLKDYGESCDDLPVNMPTVMQCIVGCSMNYHLSSNLLQGTSDKLTPISHDSIKKSLEVAIEMFHKNDRILFIATNPDHMETLQAELKTYLSFRGQEKPLIWGILDDSLKENEGVREKEVKSWLDGGKQKHLLASASICRGFEYPYVIVFCDVEANKGWNMNAMTRCYARLVIVEVNDEKLGLKD